MDDDDASLYRAWRAGDRDAGARLVERHYDAVERFFRTKVPGQSAEDLVQRAFLICADARQPYRGDSTFRSFLFGVARNVLFEFFRGRAVHAVPDFEASSICELAPGPSSIAAERSEQRLLALALRRIPLELQLALELFYWEELSVEELARALDVPVGTIKSRLHRGRQLLRDAMESLPAPEPDRASVRGLIDQWALDVRARADEGS